MVGGVEGHEAGVLDAGGQFLPLLVGHPHVVPRADGQGRSADFRKNPADIHVAVREKDLGCIVRRGGFLLQVVEPGLALGRCIRHVEGGEHLPDGLVVAAPARAHQGTARLAHLHRVRIAPIPPATRVSAEQYELGDALGMPRSIDDGFGAALREAQERKALDAEGIDNRLQILDLPLEAEVGYVPS